MPQICLIVMAVLFVLTAPVRASSVQPVFDADFIPIEVGADGNFFQIYSNQTGDVIRTMRFYFLPGLSEDPTIIGAGVGTASAEEVILVGLSLAPLQEFEIELSGLSPATRFVVSNHSEADLPPAGPDEIARITELLQMFDAPDTGVAAAPVPLPLSALLLGTGLAVLVPLREMRRRA